MRLPFRSVLTGFLLLATPLAGARAAASDPLAQSLAAMRVLDARVAAIGHRLAIAGRELCAEHQWLPGFAVHHLSQYSGDYRDAAIRAFGLPGDAPAVLAVVSGAAAERAGVRPDDILVAIDGEAPPAEANPGQGSFELMERVIEAVEQGFADGAATLQLRRGAETLSLSVEAEQGCATRFQLIPSERLNALADGRYVQVTTAIVDYAADDHELAAILAHELAHNALRHRRRLDAAGVERGFFGNFGRNARLIRETENEADRLSVYLLERAGYDPEAPVRFWSRFGRRGLNLFGSPTHSNWRRRVELFEGEIANIRRARAAGVSPVPDFLGAAHAVAGR